MTKDATSYTAVLCTRPKFKDKDRDQDRVVQDQDRDQDRIVQDQDLSLKTVNAILNCSFTYSHDSNQMLVIFIAIVFVPKSARSHEEHTTAK